MSNFAAALEHGKLKEVFPNIFFVTGTMVGIFDDVEWQFSRNMTVVREGDSLSLINSVRLNDAGLKELESLGKVENIVQIGALHGYDDAFYLDRYAATYWGMSGLECPFPDAQHKVLSVEGELPIKAASLFTFATSNLPEGVIRLEHEGGILIACDALQNWIAPDQFFTQATITLMQEMNFFQKANIGPVWIKFNEPEASDFQRLQEMTYSHVLCGHGEPLYQSAKENFSDSFKRVFGI